MRAAVTGDQQQFAAGRNVWSTFLKKMSRSRNTDILSAQFADCGEAALRLPELV
jgi:hypothetical protein